MDSMPPCHNLLDIAKTRRRLAFMRACDLMHGVRQYNADTCADMDKALDEYDSASRQVRELTEKENSEVEP
jgi:hypothetical protein